MVPVKHSIATRLLIIVFSVYLVLTIIVTAVHMVTEYNHTRRQVVEELKQIESVFRPTLSRALWEMNYKQVQSALLGLERLPAVVGFQVTDNRGNTIAKAGTVIQKNGACVFVDSHGVETKGKNCSRLFWHEFTLTFSRGDKTFDVGKVKLYSSESVVIDKVLLGFAFLIVNTVIKIIALWLIIYFVFKRILLRPLSDLTNSTRKIDLDNLENVVVDVRTSPDNELKVMERAFQDMVAKLLAARRRLSEYSKAEKEKLEVLVRERTKDLTRNEEKYRELVQNANSIILRWDTEGRITFFNEYAQNFFGYKESEILGRHVVGTIVPETESTGRDLAPLMDEICKDPKSFEYNVNENLRKDGSRVWVAWTNKLLRDENGEPEGALSIGADITGQKKTEERFRLAAEAISDLIYEWNIDNDTLEWFGDIDKALGFEKGEFPHTLEAWFKRIHPDDRARLSDAVEHHRKSTNPISYEYRIQRADGEWVYWSDYGVPVMDSEGKPCRWIGACSDITERKMAEQELVESENRYRALASNDIYALSIFDVESKKFVDVNDAWLKLYGYSQGEVDGLTIADITAEPESTQKAVKHSAEAGAVFIPERLHRKKDGTTFYVEISAAPFSWKGQKLMYALIHDISQRKHADEKMMRAKEAAETANRIKSTFLANMSHELRTPLNAILGFSQLMRRDPGLTPDQQANLETIGRSGEHLLSLINDVLEFSKIEAGQVTLKPSNFDLHQLLVSLEEMFRLRVREKGLSLKFQKAEDVPRFIQGDQSKLRQVLINLLGNAIKFTEQGEIKLSVSNNGPDRRKEGLFLGFEVKDQGIGMSRKLQQNIFDAFFQTDDLSLSKQGTGLGLPISRKFVSLMGGNLKVDSEQGKGASFSFSIPVKQAQKADGDASRPRQGVVGLEPGQKAFRLLVAEDNENSRNLLVKLLQAVGFEVKEAENGREAVKVCEEWNPDLIWMDMRMPVMDGYEATQAIKNTPEGKDTKIIALTASAFEEDRLRVIEYGCDDFVRKPFKEEEIFTMMQEHLGARYVFQEDMAEAAPQKQGKAMADEDLAEAIGNLSKELFDRLQDAVELSDVNKIGILVKEIGEQDPDLSEALAALAESFSYDKILALMD